MTDAEWEEIKGKKVVEVRLHFLNDKGLVINDVPTTHLTLTPRGDGMTVGKIVNLLSGEET